MLTIRKHSSMGRTTIDWLDSYFHFSFDHYYDPNHKNFGPLRVVNDDIIQPLSGFDLHPHKDMEIISYVVDGVITHKDNMGNERNVTRGNIQYMSAGTGVWHGEFNRTNEELRLLQLWIIPDQKGHQPNYGDYTIPFEHRNNKWLHLVSGTTSTPVQIHQAANIFALYATEEESFSLPIKSDENGYLIQIEGSSIVNTIPLDTRDALLIENEHPTLMASKNSHYLLITVKR